MNFHKLYLALLAIPKTIIFNFRYFSFQTAIRFPVLVSHRVAFQRMGGVVNIEEPIKFGMIQIGFSENRGFDNRKVRAVWHNEGKIHFSGNTKIGNGTCIAVTGFLKCGGDFIVSGNTQIICGASTTIGNGVLIGWDCMLLDYDAHKIYDNVTGFQLNTKSGISIGDNVWIGARVSILKGVSISRGCIIAANSNVFCSLEEENCVYGGCPPKVIRKSVKWRH